LPQGRGQVNQKELDYYSREFARAAWYVPFLHAWVDVVDVKDKESLVNGIQYANAERESIGLRFTIHSCA